MATKYGKVVTYRHGLPPINSHKPLNTWSRKGTRQIKNIFTLTMLMVTKLVRVVIYREKIPSVNSHDPSMRWSC